MAPEPQARVRTTAEHYDFTVGRNREEDEEFTLDRGSAERRQRRGLVEVLEVVEPEPVAASEATGPSEPRASKAPGPSETKGAGEGEADDDGGDEQAAGDDGADVESAAPPDDPHAQSAAASVDVERLEDYDGYVTDRGNGWYDVEGVEKAVQGYEKALRRARELHGGS